MDGWMHEWSQSFNPVGSANPTISLAIKSIVVNCSSACLKSWKTLCTTKCQKSIRKCLSVLKGSGTASYQNNIYVPWKTGSSGYKSFVIGYRSELGSCLLAKYVSKWFQVEAFKTATSFCMSLV